MPSVVVLLLLLGIAAAVRPRVAGWAQYGLLRRFGQSYLLFVAGSAVLGALFLLVGVLFNGGAMGGMPFGPSPMELILPLLLPPLIPAAYLTWLLGKGSGEHTLQDSAWYGDGGAPSHSSGQGDSGGGDSGGE